MGTSLRSFHWIAVVSIILGLGFLYEVIPPVPAHIGSAAMFALGVRALEFAGVEAAFGFVALIFLKAQRKRTAFIAFGFALLLCMAAAMHYIQASHY
jgi:hypothetical protein